MSSNCPIMVSYQCGPYFQRSLLSKQEWQSLSIISGAFLSVCTSQAILSLELTLTGCYYLETLDTKSSSGSTVFEKL